MTTTNTPKLIGAAAHWQKVFHAKIERGLAKPMKLLFYGAPGTGKTTLALDLAKRISGHHLAVEHLAGRDVVIEKVRDWMDHLRYGGNGMFGDATVKVIDELDTASQAAQEALLTYCDKLTPSTVLICTTNRNISEFPARLQGRFQQCSFESPASGEIASHIARLMAIPEQVANAIASGCNGDIRAALLDAETWLDQSVA